MKTKHVNICNVLAKSGIVWLMVAVMGIGMPSCGSDNVIEEPVALVDSGTTGALSWKITEDSVLIIEGVGKMPDNNRPWLSSRSFIKQINIAEGITSIGTYAFQACNNLTSIIIPNSVTSIGNYVFHNCSGLDSITIPPNITTIGLNAFSGCSLLKLIYNAKNCEIYTPGWTSITSLILGEEVEKISDYAFTDCSGLTSIIIPNSVTSIGYDAFKGCSGLTSIIIPNSVTSIEPHAFWGCSGLTSVTIGNSITSIRIGFFWGCSGLTSVTIGNSVASIDNSAFADCGSLTSIDVNADNTSYSSIDGALYNKDKTKLVLYPEGKTGVFVIPENVTSIGIDAFQYCSNLTSIDVDAANTSYLSIDGVLYSKDEMILVRCPQVKTGVFAIPENVTSIGIGAFRSCEGLTSITIPNSVVGIENGAFYGCLGLTSITVGSSVESIGNMAFAQCRNLTSITIGKSVTSIKWNVFEGCSGLTEMTVEAINPPSVDFGSFNIVNRTIPVYVPQASLQAYKNASVWNEFTNIQGV